jgi:hypothetical protein
MTTLQQPPSPEMFGPGMPVNMSVVEGGGHETLTSREIFDNYFDLRAEAMQAEKPEGEELRGIQEHARAWVAETFGDVTKPGTADDYCQYDREELTARFAALSGFLKENYPHISDVEHQATKAFVDSAFSMYEDRYKSETLTDRDGSFAFVVPARMSRKYNQYGPEVEPAVPLDRYIPNELRAWTLRGMPPFVIDRYEPDASGKRGYLVWAPVTEDMQYDLGKESAGAFTRAARENINDAVDLAVNRLGVNVVGLGATLPRITAMGSTVRKRFGEQAIVTTGHGGTVRLAVDIIERFGGRFLGRDKDPTISVIGLGAIGAAAAGIIADTQPGKVIAYDINEKRIAKVVDERPERIEPAKDLKSAIERADVIFSAVTEPINLEELGFKPTLKDRLLHRKPLKGKLIVDDSQPAAFDPKQVERMGAKVVWVIGEDESGGTVRESYDYGTMLHKTDLFGCESEAAALARKLTDLERSGVPRDEAMRTVGKLAITESVTTESARAIGNVFREYGYTPAEPQAFGKSVEFGRHTGEWWKVAHATTALMSLLIVNIANHHRR